VPAVLPLLLFALPIAAEGAQTGSPGGTGRPSAKASVDACALLTSADLRRVQGEPAQSVRRTEVSAEGLRLLQCSYTMPTFAKSVSLTLAVAHPVGRGAARNYWKEHFHSAAGGEQRADVGEGENQSEPPVTVNGIGEEAFWVGNGISGALYVLLGERFLRISAGGADSQELKQRKSVELARRAIARLSSR
jgi:hypothetical protein